jgi:site-specific recombinase XerC
LATRTVTSVASGMTAPKNQLAFASNVTGKGKNGERDRLMIETLCDGCLRVSEGLGLRPKDLVQTDAGWIVRVVGKGRKPGEAAISSTLAAHLQSYAYRQGLPPDERFFNITPARA